MKTFFTFPSNQLFLFVLLFCGVLSSSFAQQTITHDEMTKLEDKSDKEILAYFRENKVDLNMGVNYYSEDDTSQMARGFGPDRSTIFQNIAHSYGYYCDDEKTELVFTLVKEYKGEILDPFFFFNDLCRDRRNNIVAYFELIREKNTKVGEKEFKQIYEYYFSDDVDYIDDRGKTILMYACEYNYISAIKKIMKASPDTSIKSKNKKTALDYCSNKTTKEIKALLTSKKKKRKKKKK